MKKKIRHLTVIILSVIFGLAISPSCVKEDRSGCPTYIVVNIANPIPPEFDENNLINASVFDKFHDCIDAKSATIASYKEESVLFTVARNERYDVTCLTGAGDMQVQERILALTEGGCSGKLWGYSSGITTGSSEYGYMIEGRLCKSHAMVSVTLKGSLPEQIFRFELVSTTSGIDLQTFKPYRGKFIYELHNIETNKYDTIITRQADFSSLEMIVYRKDNEFAEEKLQYRLPIGRDLVKSGYNPDAEDMKDIDMEIDYSDGGIILTVNGWKLVYDGQFII